MTVKTLTAATFTTLLAACASGGTGMTSSAEQQCGALARYEGLRLVRVDGVDNQGSNTQLVRMRVEDALGRGFEARCAVADGSAKWAQPLPANVRRG